MPEQISNRMYTEAQKKRRAETQRIWLSKNPEYRLKWREDNLKSGTYYEINKVHHKETQRAWCEANPDKVRDIAARRQANTVGTLTPGLIPKLLESQKWTCIVCNKDLRLGYHIDHIVPVSKGGQNVDDNIQILCPSCNLSKGNKDFAEFLKARGLDPSGFSSMSSPSESPALEEA